MPRSLSPHRYSGRYLEHRHTSYAALGFLMLAFGVVLLLATNAAKADSSATISATINQTATPLAPTITSPVTSTHFTVTPITVTGACTSGYHVVLYKNTVLAGSTVCANDNTYTLQIDLFDGLNDLTAQQFDFLDDPSPLSAIATVYFDVPNPLPAPIGTTSSPAPVSGVAVIQQFIIRTDSPYKVANAGDQFNWPIEVLGGVPPYAISWSWGDGTTDIISISATGTYTAHHTYSKAGNYKVVIRGSDSQDHTAYLQVLAIVDGDSGPATATSGGFFDGGQLLILWPLYILMAVMLLCFWLGERYEFYRVKLRLRAEERELAVSSPPPPLSSRP